MDYFNCFHSLPIQDYPQLQELLSTNLIKVEQGTWQLTRQGFELSDLIGPWLYAPDIEQRMMSYPLA